MRDGSGEAGYGTKREGNKGKVYRGFSSSSFVCVFFAFGQPHVSLRDEDGIALPSPLYHNELSSIHRRALLPSRGDSEGRGFLRGGEGGE